MEVPGALHPEQLPPGRGDLGASAARSSWLSRICVQCTSAWISRGSAGFSSCCSLLGLPTRRPGSRGGEGEGGREDRREEGRKEARGMSTVQGWREQTPQDRKQRKSHHICQDQCEAEAGKIRTSARARTHTHTHTHTSYLSVSPAPGLVRSRPLQPQCTHTRTHTRLLVQCDSVPWSHSARTCTRAHTHTPDSYSFTETPPLGA